MVHIKHDKMFTCYNIQDNNYFLKKDKFGITYSLQVYQGMYSYTQDSTKKGMGIPLFPLWS